MTTVRARDGCVVPTEPLSTLLNGFVNDWNRQRPRSGGQFAAAGTRADLSMVDAVEWIAQETRLPEATIRNILPAKKTGRPRYRHTELRIADAIVQAVGRPELFHDGTLEVLPNPCASREARTLCCSGSLNGAASVQG